MSAASLEDHPTWKSIQAFNVEEKLQQRHAFKVYMDITEVKGWWNVKVHLCEDLQLVFLSGHTNRSKPREVILPMSSDSNCSPAKIRTYIHSIRLQDYDTTSLILAVCSSDSTTVYYRLTDGLVPPETPEVSEWKKYRHEELPQLLRHHVCEQTAEYKRGLEEQNT